MASVPIVVAPGVLSSRIKRLVRQIPWRDQSGRLGTTDIYVRYENEYIQILIGPQRVLSMWVSPYIGNLVIEWLNNHDQAFPISDDCTIIFNKILKLLDIIEVETDDEYNTDDEITDDEYNTDDEITGGLLRYPLPSNPDESRFYKFLGGLLSITLITTDEVFVTGIKNVDPDDATFTISDAEKFIVKITHAAYEYLTGVRPYNSLGRISKDNILHLFKKFGIHPEDLAQTAGMGIRGGLLFPGLPIPEDLPEDQPIPFLDGTLELKFVFPNRVSLYIDGPGRRLLFPDHPERPVVISLDRTVFDYLKGLVDLEELGDLQRRELNLVLTIAGKGSIVILGADTSGDAADSNIGNGYYY